MQAWRAEGGRNNAAVPTFSLHPVPDVCFGKVAHLARFNFVFGHILIRWSLKEQLTLADGSSLEADPVVVRRLG
jgi:hypothetical protein